MRRERSLLFLVALGAELGPARCARKALPRSPIDDPPPDNSGKPTFVVSEIKPGSDMKIVAYGDMRFTDPSNKTDTNPRVRKWLVDRIAQEKPDASVSLRRPSVSRRPQGRLGRLSARDGSVD